MQALFSNLLTASFHGSIVIAAVLVLRFLLGKAPRKFICFLWLLAGLRLLMPFEIQSGLSLQPMPEAKSPMVSFTEVIPRETFPEVPITPQSSTLPQPEAFPQTAGIPASAPVQEAAPVFRWQAAIPYVWLAVAVCFGIYTLFAYLRLRYRVREAVKIPGGWECDQIDTAFILGFLRPRIYIPMGLSPKTRGYILAHERTHLEKGDHWFKLIGFLSLALHWFNPLVWIAYILLCKDIELACDERVIQFMELEERKSYSAALLSCASGHFRFASPVAFGEVSVKDRIKKVLGYRRPSFWVSLMGVIAILFVAVCLLTNPEPSANLSAAPTETIPPETAGAVLPREEDLLRQVREGLDAMLTAQEGAVTFSADNDDGSIPWSCTYFLRGNDRMWQITDNRNSYSEVRYLLLDGVYYQGRDNLWIQCDPVEDPVDTYRQWFRWEELETVSDFSESTTTTTDGYSYRQVKFYGTGDGQFLSFTFHFSGDGIFEGGQVKGRKTKYGDTLSLFDYPVTKEEVQQRFTQAAESTMSPEEYERGKIPSNYTDYDKDFMLGSGQMRWHFFDQSWQFALGAENATPTGLTLIYRESGDDHQTLTADECFWIEKLADDRWTLVTPNAEVTNAPATEIQVSWTKTDRLTVNWKDSYGELDYGFYRLGRYHTVTMPSGEEETRHCYAKFRLYNPNQDALLRKCKQALESLQKQDSYHIYTFNWMRDFPDSAYFRQEEIWKQGADYLSVSSYPPKNTKAEPKAPSGSLWRDGTYHGLQWAGEPTATPVSSWWRSVEGYMDGSNLNLWTFGFTWYAAQVDEVIQDGNTIRIVESYEMDTRYPYSEISLTFDRKGNLTGMVRATLPTRNCSQSDKVIHEEMVVLDTPAGEIRDMIWRQDVSSPIPFSYEADVAAYPEAQKRGFQNSAPRPIADAKDAIALADKECTLPDRNAGIATPYYQTSVYRDKDAGIWKVELFWWQDDDCYQAIYMDDQGITRMIVNEKQLP